MDQQPQVVTQSCGERKERGRLDNPGWGCKADSRSLEGEKESDA